jgi:RNA polymerase sigma factor (sigma-70 family)
MNLESMTDGQLLDLFSRNKDEHAFELLAQRHANMVASVARRILPSDSDAEDVVQAVFLVLARKSSTLRTPDSIGGWLHRVTVNVAMRARDARRLRTIREREASAMTARDTCDEQTPAWQALKPVLDTHLNQLPQKYRNALVVHHLEGQSVEATAQKLAVPVGTVASWLSRGRELLRVKLGRSNLMLAAGPLATMLSQQAAGAQLSSETISRIAQAAARAAVNPAAANLSPHATALSEEELNAMSLHKYSIAAVVVLCLLLLGSGGIMAGLGAGTTVQSQSAVAKPEIAPVVSRPSPPVESDDEKTSTPPKVDPKIAALIEQLADQDAIKRIEAINKLRDADAEVTPALEAAAKNENYDISSRAAKLLEVRKLAPLVKKIADANHLYKTIEYKSLTVVAEEIFGNRAEIHGEWRGLGDGSKYVSSDKIVADDRIILNRCIRNATGMYNVFGRANSEELDGVIYEDLIGDKEDHTLRGLTTSVLGLFDLTHVKETEVDGEPLIELSGMLREDFMAPGMRALINETFGGSDLEGLSTMRKAVIRVSKIDHLLRSGEVSNEADQILASIVVSNLKTDLTFAPEEFDYTPPAGVKVEKIRRPAKKKTRAKTIDAKRLETKTAAEELAK